MNNNFHIHVFGMTDAGKRRPLNEDSLLIDVSNHCFVVSDGVGGASAGEVASSIFTTTIADMIKSEAITSAEETVNTIKQGFLTAHSNILKCSNENPHNKGMACTAEVFIVNEDGFILGHVGDSRTYRFRNNKLIRLTKDHSFVQEQLDLGIITPAEAKTHRYRNVISRAVGIDGSINVDIIRGKVRQDDIFMLCSDGLSDMVAEPDISALLIHDISLEDKVTSLVGKANEAGGRDNITIILIQIG